MSKERTELSRTSRIVRILAIFLAILYFAIWGTLAIALGPDSIATSTAFSVMTFIYTPLAISSFFYWTNDINKTLNRIERISVPPRNRIAEIRAHIDTTGKLLRELEDEMNTRTKVLEQLQTDTEHYERLASLNTPQAKAIDDMMDRKFKRQARSTRWQWWASIILAIIFGFIVNWLSSPLLDWIIR